MNDIVLSKTQNLINLGDIEGAESALVTLAEKEGDNALSVVLGNLPPADLLSIMREYDTSRESIVNLLITPEQFARAIVLERRYNDITCERLRAMVNAVIFREDADTVEFLEAIAAQEEGTSVLVDYLIEQSERVEHFSVYGTFDLFKYDNGMREYAEDFDWHMESEPIMLDEQEGTNDKDWMQLTITLHDHLPDVFKEVTFMLKERMKAIESELVNQKELLQDKKEGDMLDQEESAL